MKGRKALPLDSPDWIALSDAYPAVLEHAASSALAITDLQAALESERIRSKARWLPGPPPHAKAMQRLVPGNDWREHYEIRRRDNGIVAVARKGRSLNPFAAFFFWRPDVVKAFPRREPVADNCRQLPAKPAAAAQGKRGRRQRHRWDEVRVEILRQIVAKAPPLPDNATEIAGKVEIWCKEKHGKAPAFSTLREEVGRLIEAARVLLAAPI
jgi:hypothetical protein